MADLIARTTALIALRPGRDVAPGLAAMGQALPAMGRFSSVDGLILARVTPYQVLAMREGADAALMQELAGLGAEAGLIDLSDARIGVRMAGRGAGARLSHLITLDLHPLHFGPGQCAQTLMAHMSVLLLQHAIDDYEVQVSTSYAASFLRAIDTVAA